MPLTSEYTRVPARHESGHELLTSRQCLKAIIVFSFCVYHPLPVGTMHTWFPTLCQALATTIRFQDLTIVTISKASAFRA